MANDYIFIRKSRNALSSVLHVLMNVLLGAGSILIGLVSGSWLIGFILVLVSKWRMFAVRPRYLLLNLKSNLVDLIVGFSFVLLGFFSGSELLPVHYLLAISYTVWLIFIKPKTSKNWTLFQALVAVFLGTSASVILCASLNSALLVILEFIIGYAAARHVLVQNNNSLENGFPALLLGTLFAELSLFLHSWLIIYTFVDFGLMLPQLALVLSLLAFMLEKVYSSVELHDGAFRLKPVALPLAFGTLLILIILIGFSNPIFNV
ncbi:hypothetical protein IJI72_01055 [Candidatus Saccharibacteria bacterium]|nr:hypothetical protein [Candidatus Saccharibacteria bacterium]